MHTQHNQELLFVNEIFIQTRNLKLAALVWGDESSPPVIALHGWLDNAASFIPIASHLKHLRLIAIDLPGHGKSEHRKGSNAYHVIDYAPDVLLAAQALGLSRFSMLGHSLGAGISCMLASAMPEYVERIALIDGLAPMSHEDNNFPNQYRKHVTSLVNSSGKVTVYKTIEEAAQARMAVGDLTLESALLIAERSLTKTDSGYTWCSDRNVNKPSPIYLTEKHIEAYMNQVQCKALLLRTENGILKNWDSLKGREPYMKHMEVVDMAGRHHCHMEEPKRVAEKILPFLQG